MTDEEIFKKIREIQAKENLNQAKLAQFLGVCSAWLGRLLLKKAKMIESRRKKFEAIFALYDRGEWK